MNENATSPSPTRVGPAPKYQLALMIWVAVVPTLIALQVLLRSFLADAPMIFRTVFLSTLAVPIVVYCLMPPLQRLRVYMATRRRL